MGSDDTMYCLSRFLLLCNSAVLSIYGYYRRIDIWGILDTTWHRNLALKALLGRWDILSAVRDMSLKRLEDNMGA